MNELLENNFIILFSLVKKPFFSKKWVGKVIDSSTIAELKKLNIDICGENGEYHSMVLDAPFFQQALAQFTFNVKETDAYYYLIPQ